MIQYKAPKYILGKQRMELVISLLSLLISQGFAALHEYFLDHQYHKFTLFGVRDIGSANFIDAGII